MPARIVWTPEMVEACEDGILAGKSIEDICKELGISEASFYRHRIEDADFESSITRAQSASSEADIDRTSALAKTATAENWQLVQFQCRNAQWIAGKRKPKKYGDKVEQYISGPDGGPVQASITVNFVKPVDGHDTPK